MLEGCSRDKAYSMLEGQAEEGWSDMGRGRENETLTHCTALQNRAQLQPGTRKVQVRFSSMNVLAVLG